MTILFCKIIYCAFFDKISILCSPMVRISRFHRGDPGSIPGRGKTWSAKRLSFWSPSSFFVLCFFFYFFLLLSSIPFFLLAFLLSFHVWAMCFTCCERLRSGPQWLSLLSPIPRLSFSSRVHLSPPFICVRAASVERETLDLVNQPTRDSLRASEIN